MTYKLENFENLFSIDPHTGNITTRTKFDREVKDTYKLGVFAIDNSPSALYNNKEHNKGKGTFLVEIADMNDNEPRFIKRVFTGDSIKEDANLNERASAVEAHDNDSASIITYSIVGGNLHDSFYIENTTGVIRVKNPLDYETIKEYTLKVMAFDGIFNDTAEVKISIENVNDNPPIFMDFNTNPTMQEETLPTGEGTFSGKNTDDFLTTFACNQRIQRRCYLFLEELLITCQKKDLWIIRFSTVLEQSGNKKTFSYIINL